MIESFASLTQASTLIIHLREDPTLRHLNRNKNELKFSVAEKEMKTYKEKKDTRRLALELHSFRCRKKFPRKMAKNGPKGSREGEVTYH